MSCSAVTVWCPAKVNLHLRVVGRRADGYHELRTIFQTVDLGDRIELRLVDGDDLALDVVGDDDVPRGDDNLALRAVEAFRRRWAPELGVELTLRKRVPAAAGLGGGSSDAAGVLLALQHLLGRPPERSELWSTARELGADVPFFLWGGTALGTGRGDEIERLDDLPSRTIWLAIPELRVPTAEAFDALDLIDHRPGEASIETLAAAGELDWRLVERAGTNDLETLMCTRHPDLATIRDTLWASGASTVRMSGSGGVMLALFEEAGRAARASRRLPSSTRLLAVRTVDRSELEERRFSGR